MPAATTHLRSSFANVLPNIADKNEEQAVIGPAGPGRAFMDVAEFPRIASAENTEAAKNLLDDLRSSDSTQLAERSRKSEAQAIASHFDQNKHKDDLSESSDDGALRLSLALQSLSKNMPAYNEFLNNLQDSFDDISTQGYPGRTELVLKNFDPSTGTFKNAFIYSHADSSDSHESYRIVQPGNTLSQIAKNSYDAKVAANDGKPLGYSLKTFEGFIVEKNGIQNPNDLKVGDVLKMYVF